PPAADPADRRRVPGPFSYMALDAPPAIRDRAGLTDDRIDAIRTEMLAGRLDTAASLLPDALVDEYAVTGTSRECAERIAGLAPSFDLFVLPMNDVEHCAEHIRAGAGILRAAQERCHGVRRSRSVVVERRPARGDVGDRAAGRRA